MWSLTEPRTRKYIKGYRFLLFARNLSNKYTIQLLDIGLDSLKPASKKVVHKTGEFLGNKIADALAKSCNNKIVKKNPVINENPRSVEEIIISADKREEILNELRQVL